LRLQGQQLGAVENCEVFHHEESDHEHHEEHRNQRIRSLHGAAQTSASLTQFNQPVEYPYHHGDQQRQGQPEANIYIHQSSTFSTARKASWGISTLPTCFIRFLPSFCFWRSFFLRDTSPP